MYNNLDSVIIENFEEFNLLYDRLKKNGHVINFKLLYRKSIDGKSANDFHKKCDGKSNTLILIKTKSGRRFGGFTEAEWDNYSKFKNYKKGFVFSIDNNEIYHNSKGDYNIYCYNNIGPSFRGGPHDFTISNYANMTDQSFEYIYDKYIKNERKYVLEGNKNFYVKDYEVYQIELE